MTLIGVKNVILSMTLDGEGVETRRLVGYATDHARK